MVSFAVQKLLSLSRSHLFIFAFIFFTLGDWSKKYSAIYVKESSILFFSGSLIVSSLMFLSLILLLWWETMKISSKDTQFSFYLKIFSINCLFIYTTALDLSCSMWDLFPWPGIEPGPPALGDWSLSHWTTMGSPQDTTFLKKPFSCFLLAKISMIIRGIAFGD